MSAAFGAVLGVATALVALAVAQAVAAFISSQVGEPVDAVGELSINHTPPSLKNFAIREFGSNDKTVLVWGIRAVLIVFAIVIGILALRKLWYGLIGLAVFIAIGVYAAESQPTSRGIDALPTLIGGLAAALFMWRASGVGRRALTYRAGAPARLATAPRATPPRAVPPPTVPSKTDAPPPEPPASRPPSPTEAEPQDSDPWQGWLPSYDRDSGSGWRDRGRPAARPALSGYEDQQSRRRFLLASAGAAGASLAVYAGATWLAENRAVSVAQKSLKFPRAATAAPPLPAGYDLKIPGLSPFITPNGSFYRVDTAIVLPEVLPASWHLRIHGMVQRELVLSFDDLIRRPLLEDYITLCCVSNPVGGPYVGNAKWLGASLRSLLQQAGIRAGADQLLCTSADGFTSGTPVQTAMDGRDAMLAVAMNGTALPIAHGFPARLVIPGLYGYVSACKWITDIEVTTYAANTSYWAQRGWSAQAPIKTESRIDVPGFGASVKAGHQTAIAGVAWAQHKGIDAVEVKVGSGPWQPAQLASVPDLDTWRQWVYQWDANVEPGNYVIQARATDKTGYTQTSLQEPPEPNGASGYPSTTVTVTS